MRDFFNTHKQLIDRAAFFAVITIAVYLFFNFLFSFLAPFFFGLLIALIMEPLIRLMVNKFGWGRRLAAWICLLLFLAAAGSLGAWIVITLIRQMSNFVASAPEHIEVIVLRVNDTMDTWITRIEAFLPANLYMPDLQEALVARITSLFGGGFIDQAMNLAVGVPNFFVGLILALVSAYFFMADRGVIFNAIRRACPPWLRGHMRDTRAGLSRAIGGYLRAQYILMTMVGIISIIGLLILRSPFALLLGLLLAALDFLPILGPALVLVPWALVAVINGDFTMAIGLAVIYGIITITRQVLQPKILGDQMGAHPLASLMSIFIGFRVFGLLGLIIGPSLLMIFIAIRERGEEQSTYVSDKKTHIVASPEVKRMDSVPDITQKK